MDIVTLCKGKRTDKNRGKSPHARFYDRLFFPYRDEEIKLLEIGVLNGGSIALWEAYFSKAKLFFIDINEKCLQYTTERSSVELVDQSNADELLAYANKVGEFDIIIDDGRHKTSYQILSFQILWEYLSPGGLYVIEDTNTSYWAEFIDSVPTCLGYFKNLIDDMNSEFEERKSGSIDIDYILFKYNMIVIAKKNITLEKYNLQSVRQKKLNRRIAETNALVASKKKREENE